MSNEQNLEKIIEEVYQRAKRNEIEPWGDVINGTSRRRWIQAGIFNPFITLTQFPYMSCESSQYPCPIYAHCKTKRFIRRLLTGYNVKTLDQALSLYTEAEYMPISNAEEFILNIV